MAAMSVIGIDFGNESCYVAVARAGGIETIANDYSLRATPSCVAFSGRNRILGVAAKNQMVTNMKNTIHGFKRLLGRKLNDPRVQSEARSLPFTISTYSDKAPQGIGIKVKYMDEDYTFNPEQITAMLLTKLKDVSEQALKTKVNDCVISVPSYFTNAERKALLDAAHIAGLNVLRLMNESTATALSYGIYKQDLPNPDEKPRNVIFVDCGHSSLQVSACSFNKGKLKMLACSSEPNLGGRDIDKILADHFSIDFSTRYKIDPRGNARAYLRLLSEVEKLKKQISANSTTLPLNIECFMEDKDVHGELKRVDMEGLCAHLFHKVEITLRRCLEDSKLRPEEIYAVEIVGGSSRIPAIKHLIEVVFGKSPSTTLNQDEAVARGCALQCAMLSPAVRVRDFSITDIQNYPVKLVWDPHNHDGEMEVFPQYHPMPFSKMLTFYRKEDFEIKAYYNCDVPHTDKDIGHFIIKDVRPTAEGESSKIKVKVRINLHGIVSIVSAVLVEKKDNAEAEETQMETEPAANDQEGADQVNRENGDVQQPNEEEEKNDKVDKKDVKKKKSVTKTLELPIDAYMHGFTQSLLNDYYELECKMIANDKQEKERVDARNALEEYVYDLRGKISSSEELSPYVLPQDKTKIISELDNMESWLYEEGEDCPRQVYVEKFNSLKQIGEPIKKRKMENENRPLAMEEYAHYLQLSHKFVEQYKAGDEKYNHIAPSEVAKVEEDMMAASKWLDEKRNLLRNCPMTVDPPVTIDQIRAEKKRLEQSVTSIMNKPKPKIEPPVEPAGDNKMPTKSQAETSEQQSPADQQQQQQQPPTHQEKMDVE